MAFFASTPVHRDTFVMIAYLAAFKSLLPAFQSGFQFTTSKLQGCFRSASMFAMLKIPGMYLDHYDYCRGNRQERQASC